MIIFFSKFNASSKGRSTHLQPPTPQTKNLHAYFWYQKNTGNVSDLFNWQIKMYKLFLLLGDPNTFGITYCFRTILSYDFLPILFALYRSNYLTLRPKTSTYDYYRANLELRSSWVTWPTCDVI